MMAIPEHLGPGFNTLAQEWLSVGVSSLAKHIYVKLPRTPGIRGQDGQNPTSNVELYVDLSSDELTEPERSHWQAALGCSEGLHIIASEHRSQLENLKAAVKQLETRLSMSASS